MHSMVGLFTCLYYAVHSILFSFVYRLTKSYMFGVGYLLRFLSRKISC